MIFFPKTFKNIQCYSDLSHASSGAGKQGKCSESCFLVFLQEQEHRKQGPKGRENEEKRNSLKENATKHHSVALLIAFAMLPSSPLDGVQQKNSGGHMRMSCIAGCKAVTVQVSNRNCSAPAAVVCLLSEEK